MYAIIEDSGTQIKVSEGDVIKVALREGIEEQVSINFDRVLLVGDETGQNPPRIGTPLLEGARVNGDILSQERTDRVPVVKFKRRKNYRRRKSHRQDYLKVKITAIEA